MKKIITTIICAIALTACDKVYINGELDGMWRVSQVEYADSTCQPTDIFYSFQRHLSQVGKYYDEEQPVRFLGELDYNGNRLSMSNFHRFPLEEYPATLQMLKEFHLYSDSTAFTIVTLNEKTLIMQSEERTYTLRKW